MALVDRLAPLRCFTAERYRPFFISGRRMGWVLRDHLAWLEPFKSTFRIEREGVFLEEGLVDAEARSAAVSEVLTALVAEGRIKRLRDEAYPIKRDWLDPPLALADRRAATFLGFRAFGLHVNGYVRRAGELFLWVGVRARDKAVAPGKLDHLVAGGQPAGLSLRDNLIKEAAEEASVPEALARRARPVGALSYLCDWGEEGCKDDLLFLYDLEVPEDFLPRCSDGEVERFELWPISDVLERLRSSDDFKFNVGPVIIDFLVRHGQLDPDEEAAYAALAFNLRENEIG